MTEKELLYLRITASEGVAPCCAHCGRTVAFVVTGILPDLPPRRVSLCGPCHAKAVASSKARGKPPEAQNWPDQVPTFGEGEKEPK